MKKERIKLMVTMEITYEKNREAAIKTANKVLNYATIAEGNDADDEECTSATVKEIVLLNKK